MEIRQCLRGALLSAMVAGAVVSAADAAEAAPVTSENINEAFGALVGVVTDSAGRPVAHTTVTAVRRDAHGVRATISGSDGAYSFNDLPAGTWVLSAQASGVVAAKSPPLQVYADQATRSDIVVTGVPNTAAGPAVAAAPVTSAPAATVAQATPAPGASMPTVPLALQAPDPAPANDTHTPFADVDTTWMNGSGRNQTPIFDTKFFTPEVRFDVNYLQDSNHPIDHTIDGSTEEFRSQEFQIEQVSVGGNFHWDGVQARLLTMAGLFGVTTPRNDASYGVGQWDLQGAYKYFSEANAGYHWDNVGHGLNVDAGIFVSYIGLFSYYNFDNWTYQPSFVSSNTPWFFNGLRIQYWPTQNLKIEPWLINGWQSYAMYNHHPGVGGQILWIPNSNLKFVFNSYFLGEDNVSTGGIYQLCNGSNPLAPSASVNVPGSEPNNVGNCSPNAPSINPAHIQRFHEDDSVLVKYYDAQGAGGLGISKAALSFTFDFGCQYGGGVSCLHGPTVENFIGAMLYNRAWFHNDLYAVTLGGGFYNNPGRYLALLPPINGATASTGTPYFTENPGQKLFQYDAQLNFQYMPKQWITWWTEVTYRHSNVPYFTGPGGITPPGTVQDGTQLGSNPTQVLTQADGATWYPDLVKREIIYGAGVMVKF